MSTVIKPCKTVRKYDQIQCKPPKSETTSIVHGYAHMLARVSKATNKQPIDISASGIGFDLNTRLLWPGLVELTCRAAIVNLWSFSCMTLRIDVDQTQCACAHDMSNRLIARSPSPHAPVFEIWRGSLAVLGRACFNVQWCTKCAVINENVHWWKAVCAVMIWDFYL